MLIITFFVWCIIIYHILHGLFLFIMNFCNGRAIVNSQLKYQNKKTELPVSFTILVPCWKEQKIIQQTIKYFSSFKKSPYVSKIIILTSLGEQDSNELRTSDLARDCLHDLQVEDFINVVECPRELIGKSQKLNYGIQKIIDHIDPKKKQYFCIYDADSRPNINTINIVVSCMKDSNTYADIYQQVSSYCNNLNSVKGLGKLYSIADAIAQTHWALGFEYSLYREYNFCCRKGYLTPPFYLIGHGCFVSLDYYRRIGKIPEINHCDDAALGFLSGLMKANLQILPVLDTCDVAPTSLSSIMQSKSWYNGSSQYLKNIRFFMKQYSISPSKVQIVYWVLRESFRNFLWGWRAPLLILSLIIGLAFHLPYVPFGVILALLLFVELPYFSTLFVLKKIQGADFSPKVLEIFCGSAMALVTFVGRCVGPLMGSIDFRQDKNNFTYKTKR